MSLATPLPLSPITLSTSDSLPIRIFVGISIHLFICLLVYTYIYLRSICKYIYIYIYLSILSFIHPFIYTPITIFNLHPPPTFNAFLSTISPLFPFLGDDPFFFLLDSFPNSLSISLSLDIFASL